MSKDKKSILEEATTDLMEIVEAAKKQAKDDLAKKFPDKFDMLLKEELNKLSSNESVNESEKGKEKEPVVEGKKTDKKKESINEELDMTEFSMDEVESAFDTATDQEEFAVVPDEDEGGEVTVDSIATAINSIGDLSNEKEMAEEAESVSDPYNKFKEMYEQMGQYVKEMEDQKMDEEYSTAFDSHMTENYGEGYAQALGEETCGRLKETFIAHKQQGEPFGDNSHKAPNVNESKTEPFIEKGKNLSEDEDQPFEDKSDPSAEQGQSVAEQKEQGGKQNYKGREDGGPTTAMIKEEDDEEEVKVDIEIEAEKENGEDKDPVDEIHGQSYSAGKVRSGTLPNDGQDYRNRAGHERTRAEWGKANEAYKKRMGSLINENKKLTKEVNDAKKSFGKAEKLVESYKNHLEKYRTQLREMAVFNTNLANVNNLLVNEELALTTNDKVSIISKFKSINSIDESDKTYGALLTEMTQGKQTMTEDVETKVSTSIGTSSKQKIDEAIERTAYENNDHVNKIKKLMKYVDNRK